METAGILSDTGGSTLWNTLKKAYQVTRKLEHFKEKLTKNTKLLEKSISTKSSVCSPTRTLTFIINIFKSWYSLHHLFTYHLYIYSFSYAFHDLYW